MGPLVSTHWLNDALGSAGLRILDATFFLPGSGRDARAEHEQARIPGAAFMDLDYIVDPGSPLPHMMPSTARFAEAMAALGVSENDQIIVYDNSPLHSAARAWWMLKAFGAVNVSILDGGMQKWRNEGRPVSSGRAAPAPARFAPAFDGARIVDKDQLRSALGGPTEIIDARSPSRFAGEEAEPRPGLVPGHIPGSRNLHYASLFEPDNSFKSPAALADAFREAGVDLARPMVTTCGSGITAAVIAFAAHLIGKGDVALYDGSWSEWGGDPELPKAIGRS